MSSFENPQTLLNIIGKTWHTVFKNELSKSYILKLLAFIRNEQKSKVVFPPEKLIFSWTELTPLDKVKVVILGQDPYHGPGQAHGLAFSVLPSCKPPPSLVNIYKELSTDIEGFKTPPHGDLTGWAKQGVLLLNAVLTVNKSAANSHKDKGWEQVTDAIIRYINQNKKNIVFILWGNYAQKKCAFIDRRKHRVIQCTHPSPLSARNGFFGSKCFSKTNNYLVENEIEPIDWAAL